MSFLFFFEENGQSPFSRKKMRKSRGKAPELQEMNPKFRLLRAICMRYRSTHYNIKKHFFFWILLFGIGEISLFANLNQESKEGKTWYDRFWGNNEEDNSASNSKDGSGNNKSDKSDNSDNNSGSNTYDNSPPQDRPPSCKITTDCKNNLNLPMDALPIVDWINTTNISSFFQSSIKRILFKEEYFGEIDSFDQFSIWIEPFGLHSKYNSERTPFTFNTIGVSLGGGYNLDGVVIGGGLGGLHSKLNGKKTEDSSINSLYFGPYLGYTFEKGYLACMVLGKWNQYDINSKREQISGEFTGWNIDTRLEGGVDIETLQFYVDDFFIQPNFTIDYFNVFQNKNEEKSFPTENRHASFFRSLLALQFRKEYFKSENGLIIPNMSIGWIRMQPVTRDGFSIKYKGSDQLFFGFSLIGIQKRGILASINFEANIGRPYTTYIGNFRLEFDW